MRGQHGSQCYFRPNWVCMTATTDDDGVEVKRARLAAIERELSRLAVRHGMAMSAFKFVELRSFLDRQLPEWLDQLDPVIAPAVRSAESRSALGYLARVVRLADLARAAAARLDTVDVIASPTLCLTPPLMSEVADADSHLRVNRRIVRNTAWVNYLGLCAMTMPVGRDRAGMPVGLQLTAPARAEEKLLTIALAAERVLGVGADRLGTPPLLAA
jgi:aspartyl-tRNA(Asn)/glutamyl-tRNA(Gln) amidotransferase subunit A